MAVVVTFKVGASNGNLAANGSVTATGLNTSGASMIMISASVGNNSSSTVSGVTVGGSAATLGFRQVLPDGFSHVETWWFWSAAALTAASVVATFANSAGAGTNIDICEATGTDASSIGNSNGANGSSGTSAAGVVCSATGSVMYGSSLNFGSSGTEAAGANTTLLNAQNDGAGDFAASSFNNQATTSGTTYTVTTTHTTGQWGMAVVEIKPASGGGGATQPPPPRFQVPRWPEAVTPINMRIGIAAILATAAVASVPPPSRQQAPNFLPAPSVPIQPRPWVAAFVPAPAAPNAPLPNDINNRKRPSLWPVSEWIVRQPTPKIIPPSFTSKYPISRSGMKMFDAQGFPFRIKGRTAWGVITLGAADLAEFLDDTVSHGYNAIECQMPDRLVDIFNMPKDGGGNLPFNNTVAGGTWNGTFPNNTSSSNPDLTTPNTAFWANVDAVVNACYTRNLLCLFFPAYLGIGGSEGWKDILTANGSTKSQAYGAFVAARYAGFPNIVWMTAGDTASGFTEESDLITGITSVGSQASGPNFSAERNGGSISSDGSGVLGTTMTLNGAYDWATVITQCQRAYTFGASTRAIPAFLLEEPYDEEGTDGTGVNTTFATQPTRRYEWWGWLNTIGGYVAGNGYIWRFAPSGTPLATDNWKNHKNTQATQDLGRLNAFIELWSNTNDLVPGGLGGMRSLVVSGAGTIDTSNFNCAAQTTAGDLLIAYVSPGGASTIQIDMRSMAGRPIKARWWDPTAATFTTNGSAAGTFTLSNSASAQSFTTPGTNSAGDNDWVLVMEAQAATPDSILPGPLQDQTNSAWFLPTQQAPQRRATIAAIIAQQSSSLTIAATVPAPTSAITLVEDFDMTIAATVPAPTSAITLTETFAMTVAATVPAPTSAISFQGPVQLIAQRAQRPAFFGWDVSAVVQPRSGIAAVLPLPITGTIAATVSAPTSAITLTETFAMTVAATVPAPISAITLVEDFDMTIGATVPAPTSAITLQGPVQLIASRAQRPAFFGWDTGAAVQRRSSIAAVLPLPITGTITATVPAPTSVIALNTPVTSFTFDVAGTVPAPTAALATNETPSVSVAGTVPAPTAALALAEVFTASIAGTVPAPTAALALAEAFSMSVAGTVPAPTAALALAEAFSMSVAGTVPAPTAALALAEVFTASIAGTVPAPTAALAFGGISNVSVGATVPVPTSAIAMDETLSVSVVATVPAPLSAMTLNSQSANPTLTSVTPAEIFTGGMLVTLSGTNFQTPYPIPESNGVLPDPLPTVQVLFDGVQGDDVQVYSGTKLTVVAPAHDPATVSVTVNNLDQNGDPVPGETFTLPNAVTYKRADLSVSADFTRVNKTLIRLLKQQVIANVSMATSVDYSDQAGNPLKVSAVASVPAVTISPPSTRLRYGEYAEDADRNEENIGVNFNRRSTFRTIDITWQIRIFDDNEIRALNLLALLHQVLKDNVLLSMDRDPADLSKGKVQYELYPNGEFNFADSPNNSNLFVASGAVTLYGYWFEDIASFPEQAVVEKGVQAETIEVTTGAFRP